MARQFLEYHPTYGYQFIPGIKARVDHEGGGFLLRTNEAGFRAEREFTPAKGDRFRVLLFGDSFTAGDGVSNKHRYSEQVERLVPGIEIFNYGLSGSGTDQQYLIWRDAAERVEHDAVVIGLQLENIRRVAAKYRQYTSPEGELRVHAKPYFSWQPDGSLELCNVPVPKGAIDEREIGEHDQAAVDRGGRFTWLRSVVRRMGPSVKEAAQRISRYQPLPAFDSADHSDWVLLRAILKRWFAESDKPVVVFPIPIHQYIEETASPEGYQQRFRELARDFGVVVHDPLRDLCRVPLAERRAFRFETDVHPTPVFHRLLAESLAPRLAELIKESA